MIGQNMINCLIPPSSSQLPRLRPVPPTTPPSSTLPWPPPSKNYPRSPQPSLDSPSCSPRSPPAPTSTS